MCYSVNIIKYKEKTLSDNLTEQFVLANCIETVDKIESHLDRIATASEKASEDIVYYLQAITIALDNQTEETNKTNIKIANGP